jgi:hypothetical protein
MMEAKRWKGFAKKKRLRIPPSHTHTGHQVSWAFRSGPGSIVFLLLLLPPPPLFGIISFLLHDDVRCREEDGQRGDDGEHGENEEADAIDDHSGKLPFGDEIVFVVLLLQLGRDEAELPYDRLQVPLSLLSRNNKNTFFKSLLTFILFYYFFFRFADNERRGNPMERFFFFSPAQWITDRFIDLPTGGIATAGATYIHAPARLLYTQYKEAGEVDYCVAEREGSLKVQRRASKKRNLKYHMKGGRVAWMKSVDR